MTTTKQPESIAARRLVLQSQLRELYIQAHDLVRKHARWHVSMSDADEIEAWIRCALTDRSTTQEMRDAIDAAILRKGGA